MNNEALFRQEALEARREDWLGAPRLMQPIQLRVMAWAGFAATSAILLFLALGSYTHRIRLSGEVVSSSGIVRVYAPADGRIVKAALHENIDVSRGDPVFTIDTGSETEHGSTAPQLAAQLREEEREVSSEIERQHSLERLETQMLAARKAQIKQELAQYNGEIQSVESYLINLNSSFERYRALTDRGLGIEEKLQDRKERIIIQKARLQTLHRAVLELTNEQSDIETDRKKVAMERASERGALQRNLARLRRERIEIEAGHIRVVSAPVDGTVTAIIAKANEMVEEHAPVLSILPHGSRPKVHLLAPARAIGFLRAGRSVVLRYSAYPHEKFGQQRGIIESVSRVALPDTEGAEEPRYRIIVIPEHETILAYGQPEPLRPGMTVEADILLDRRRLYEWILAPLIALRNDITKPGETHEP